MNFKAPGVRAGRHFFETEGERQNERRHKGDEGPFDTAEKVINFFAERNKFFAERKAQLVAAT